MVFQASLRSLRSTFDPDGEKIFLQEDIGHPEYLVTDVSTMDWPEKLELNMSERLVGGTNTKVFSLRPQLWIDKKETDLWLRISTTYSKLKILCAPFPGIVHRTANPKSILNHM